MDLSNVSDEELKAEIARREQSQDAGPTGIHEPSKFMSTLFNSANKMGQTDPQTKQFKSYGKGDRIQKELSKLPPEAQAYVEQRLVEAMKNAKAHGRELNKYDLKAIEDGTRAKFRGIPRFDISARGTFDSTMAEIMNSTDFGDMESQDQKPAAPAAPAAPATPAKTEPEPASKEQKPAGNQVGNSNSAVANAKVGDWIKRKDGSIHVLTQQDIDWAKKKIPSKVGATPTPTPTPTPTEKTKPTEPIYTPEEKQKLTQLTGGRFTGDVQGMVAQGKKYKERDTAKAKAVKKNNPAIDELEKVNNRLSILGMTKLYGTPEYKELEERRKTLERVAKPGMAAVNEANKDELTKVVEALTRVNNRLYALGSVDEHDTPEYKELEERRKTLMERRKTLESVAKK